MSNVPSRGKSVMTVLICLGLVILAVILFATAAQGAAKFITTPIGYAPAPQVHEARQAVQDRLPPRPVVHAPVRALAAPTRLPNPKPSGGCYAEPGTPPHSVMMRESGGDPKVWNGGAHHKLPGHSTASGCWGFIHSTWGRYKGYENAADAPVSVQNEKAKETYNGGSGKGHWRQTHP